MTDGIQTPLFYLSMSIPPDKLFILEGVARQHGLKVSLVKEDNAPADGKTKPAISVCVIGDRQGELGENWRILTECRDASEAMEKARSTPEKEK